MIKPLLKLLLTAVFAGLALPGFGQQDATQGKNLILKFSPQHLFQRGYHISIEKPLSSLPGHSLIVAPHFYHGDTRFIDGWTNRYSDIPKHTFVKGYGADLQHRLYLPREPTESLHRVYVAYGTSFSTFDLDYELQSWEQEPDTDGLLYYRNSLRPYNEKINRWGLTAMLGVQGSFLSENILADMYIGVGYRKSSSKTSGREPNYNQSFLDFGHTGLYPMMGFNIGYAF